MPRPIKCRKVCSLPPVRKFVPAAADSGQKIVVLTVDEYEAIRLIDNEGFSQEECSGYMDIARTTVQQIYDRARRKLAHALVEGLPLKIEGGSYRLCDGKERICFCGGCPKHRLACREQRARSQNKGGESKHENRGNL